MRKMSFNMLFLVAALPLLACPKTTETGEETGTPTPESTIQHTGSGMTCSASDGSRVNESIVLDLIASCDYFRDTQALDLAAYGSNVDDHTGYMQLHVSGFTGEGTYQTTPASEGGVWVALSSGVGTDDCDNCGTWTEGDLLPADGIGCTIEVAETGLEDMELTPEAMLETGRIQMTVTCEILNDYGNGTDTQSASLEVPGFRVDLDIYDCRAGF